MAICAIGLIWLQEVAETPEKVELKVLLGGGAQGR